MFENSRRRIRTADLKVMNLARFRFSTLRMGEDGVEPPEPLSNRFTVGIATSTKYSPITRKPRVSNMFIVLCFPLGCFMPCQPHGVVSDLDINVFSDNDETFYISPENFLSSTCTYWRQFNSETVPNGRLSPSNRLCRYTPFTEIIHIHSFSSFFCPLNG